MKMILHGHPVTKRAGHMFGHMLCSISEDCHAEVALWQEGGEVNKPDSSLALLGFPGRGQDLVNSCWRGEANMGCLGGQVVQWGKSAGPGGRHR